MQSSMSIDPQPEPKASFRHFFFRGLGILLPTVLTIWLVVLAYNFVDQKIARHINTGVRLLVIEATPWPRATEEDYVFISNKLDRGTLSTDKALTSRKVIEAEADWSKRKELLAGQNEAEHRLAFVKERLDFVARRHRLQLVWSSIKLGDWAVLNLIGLFIALIIIYLIGRLLGGYIGRRMYEQGERLLLRLPVFKQVYPYVKQVTDFFVGDKDDKLQFNRVVAVQYPRKGLWSIGLVTGETMRTIQDNAQRNCMTVFIPSSPTPFTGYVITVPVEDTVEVSITIDDALRFCVSGGVIVPESQVISGGARPTPIAVSQPVAPGAGEEAVKSG